MNKNIDRLDRTVRISAGLALIRPSLTGTIGLWGWIGIIPLATGLINFCPLYSLPGVNTGGYGQP